MQQLILAIHVIVAICLIVLVLVQHGKGADVGATFGSGASSTMFGSTGATPFLVKLTAGLAGIFFITSLILGYVTNTNMKKSGSVLGVPSTEMSQPVPVNSKK
jgi:preprotein translocase subunit SecG